MDDIDRVKPYLTDKEYAQAWAAHDLVNNLVNLGDTRRETAFGLTDASVPDVIAGVDALRQELRAALDA